MPVKDDGHIDCGSYGCNALAHVRGQVVSSRAKYSNRRRSEVHELTALLGRLPWRGHVAHQEHAARLYSSFTKSVFEKRGLIVGVSV